MRMKTIGRQFSLAVILALSMRAPAATRICSVYVDSMAELQKGVALAIEAYQMPILGLLPMTISGALPGGALLDSGKPLALHLLDVGKERIDAVAELTPAGALDEFLKALAAEGAALPEPENF